MNENKRINKLISNIPNLDLEEFDNEDFEKFINEEFTIPVKIKSSVLFKYKDSYHGHRYNFFETTIAINKNLNATNSYASDLLYFKRKITEEDLIKIHIANIDDLYS